MCSMSFVGDHYRDQFQDPIKWPSILPNLPGVSGPVLSPAITRQEFDALKAEVENMKALLIRAKEYDERTGQPDCETESKVELIKKIAELVGVSLEDVFGSNGK